MTLLYALFATQTGDTDPHDYTADYNGWIGKQAAVGGGTPPPLQHPERSELTQVKLYDALSYFVGMGTTQSQLLGMVLAIILGPTPSSNPGTVTLLRNSLRTELIEEFVKLKLKYP